MDICANIYKSAIFKSTEKLQLSLKTYKVKVGVLRPVQQPGSYMDKSSALPLVGLEPQEMAAYD